MRRTSLKVIAAVTFTLAAGAGVAHAAPGIPLEPAPHGQVSPVGSEATPIGVSPGSSDAASLACLLQSLSAGAKYCL
ncbi:hypothetical protein F5X71_34980 [Nocardia brasiliensis]|uniref:Uncharacterized protein n=1 Tax=Nocardia brasiliensis TaxID=37326 RepID=A0A6G9Y126_NOCBR|nr:hypothetical protein [Nocardia brasiliensis]QIS06830.1 hypothetical protein F5X71_34980 [Nocardia brasiliensis]